MTCFCQSGLSYIECCGPYHEKKLIPESALILMRSRYSAYAKHLPDYIIETTHRDNPSFSTDKEAWRDAILEFCRETDFRGLNVHEFLEGPTEAFVTFYAHLVRKNVDVSFTEKSHFVKEGDHWYYHSASILDQ